MMIRLITLRNKKILNCVINDGKIRSIFLNDKKV